MRDMIDIFFNNQFIGILEAKETATKKEVSKAAQSFLPRRTVVIKKEIFIPHKSITLIEKIEH